MAGMLHFSACGCTTVHEVVKEVEKAYFQRSEKGYFAGMDYLNKNCDKRFNPALLVEGTKSIIVFLAPFGDNKYIKEPYTGNNCPESSLPDHQNSSPEQPKISQYAIGEDYHNVIKDQLFLILKKLKEADPTIQGRPFVDSAPVLERYWAKEAGLGFIGKNNFLISPACGIRNFIGVLLINKEIPPTLPAFFNGAEAGPSGYAAINCGTCDKCIKACPTGALDEPYSLNANVCTSYLTIEAAHKNRINKKENSTINKKHSGRFDILSDPEEATPVNGWLFGCDECMNACPWNSRNLPSWREFLKRRTDGNN